MEATRHRLRWISGVAPRSFASEYGSGQYGYGVYGYQPSGSTRMYGDDLYGEDIYGMPFEAVILGREWEAIPWTAGQPTTPSWMYRVGDTYPPLQGRVYADGVPADLSTIDSAAFILTPIDGRPRLDTLSEYGDGVYGRGFYGEIVDVALELVLEANPDLTVPGLLTHVWQPLTLYVPGVYRVTLFIYITSDRTITVPYDDRHTLVVIDERRVAG